MTLGFAGYFGGFGAFLLVAGLGALGLILGGFLQGDLVLGDFVRRRDEGRRSRDDFGRQEESRRPRSDSGHPRSRVR
jgi:hypothetical protein